MVVGVLATGCHRGESNELPTWAAEPRPYSPSPVSANAYDAYALAAIDAEAKGGESLQRVSFFPDQRKEAALAIKSAVASVVAATAKPCDFQFVPHKPFQPIPYQPGWRLIGRVIVWQVEDACQAADYDRAISSAVAATRFGFGLTGGGGTDASLGYSIVDEARRVIAPVLGKMSPTQLDRLAKGMKSALDAKPKVTKAIKNERENTLLMIQGLQDGFKSGNLKTFQTNLGSDTNEAIRYLEGLSGNASKSKAYFASLGKAAEEERKLVESDSEVPASKRTPEKTKYDAAWKKLAKHVFGAARPLLAMDDATLARTRLLILYAQMTRLGLEHKPYPKSLDSFTKELTIDPFSGAAFVYHADAAEFSIYSVGINGQDDGGDSDASFTKPDLRLEISN